MPTLTKRSVDELSAREGQPVFLWDSGLRGFGVKALPSGAKRYLVKYRTGGGGRSAPQRWMTLGTHGHITCDQARSMAQQALAAVARGQDPQGEKEARRAAPRFVDAWHRFEEEYLPSRKPQTAGEYRRQWRDMLGPAFGNVPVADLARSDIDRMHKRLRPTPYQANRVLALCSRLLTLCEVWGWRPQGTNPCRYVEKFEEVARERFLSASELQAVGAELEKLAVEGRPQRYGANAVRLLLLTGARLNEVLTARWNWVDWDRRLILLPDSKTGAKPLYLSDAAIDVLRDQREVSGVQDSCYIIPGRNPSKPFVNLRKMWTRVCDRAGVGRVRIHDLRHTAASVAVGEGTSLPVIGRVLGHSQAQTTMRYAHVGSDPALEAVNAIGRALGDLWKSPEAKND